MSRLKRAIHIYQRSVNGEVIFYTLQDCLVFYTLVSVYARKHGIPLLGVAIMYNHYHILAMADNREDVRWFVSGFVSWFSRWYNEDSGLRGMVFQSPFGSAPKYGDKNIRTAAGYLYNNHTNKKLCNTADGIRWNFLAYSHNSHPFSKPIILKEATHALRNALRVVEAERKTDRPLNYATLRRLYKALRKEEKDQLTDYIINAYNAIDYNALESLYRSYEDMLYSFNANTFNEYDISEDSEERKGDDRVYYAMAKYILTYGGFNNLKDILRLPHKERVRLALRLHDETGASYKQIGAFLHISISAVSNTFKGVDFPPPEP